MVVLQIRIAAFSSSLTVVKCLIKEKGTNVLAKNNLNTVLHKAVHSRNEEIISLVLN
jgi:hypothetical protein